MTTPSTRSDALQTDPLIAFERVGKVFVNGTGAAAAALADVTLAIPRGRIVAIVGHTGCGKTTLLNIAAGLEAPTAGTIRLAGDLRIGTDSAYVFQHYTLLPWLTVVDNVAFGLRMRFVSRRKRRCVARELLEQLGLQGHERSRPHELSGGMRQRAAVAQALAIDPKLLLMDEPFGALDEATRRRMQTDLVNLQRRRGMTVMFVTHSIDEALLLGDRVIVLGGRPGRIVEDLAVDLPHPRSRTDPDFTDRFLHIRRLLSQPAT